MQCSEGLFHWALESMIRCCLEYMIRVELLQIQIGIHETNFQFWEKWYEFRQRKAIKVLSLC